MEHTSVCDRSRIPKATQRFAFMQQSQVEIATETIVQSLRFPPSPYFSIPANYQCISLKL